MHDQIKFLYERIKKGEISDEEAVKQLKSLKARLNPDSPALSGAGKIYPEEVQSAKGVGEGGVPAELMAALLKIASGILRVGSAEIDTDAQLDEYGFDPITLTEFTNELNRIYPLDLTPGLFIHCTTLDSLAHYLVGEYRDFFEKKFPSKAPRIPSGFTEPEVVPVIGEDILREKTVNYIKTLLSSVIKLSAGRLEADEPLEKYGIDSVMTMELTDQLEKVFGTLPKTLFYEYRNLRELGGYFLENFRERLMKILGSGERTAAVAGSKNPGAVTGTVIPAIGSRRSSWFLSRSYESGEDKLTQPLDIAIIGVSGRYPKAGNLKEFWKNLQDGRDCITEIPSDRWDHSQYYDEDKNKPGKTYCKWGGFIDGVDRFDPLFFNISPRDAAIMDPQERLFLECVYETMEDAGYTRETLDRDRGKGRGGNVGVFVGVMYEEYQLYGARETMLGRPIALSGNPSSVANRVSYFCDFHGPSIAIDTMCSSSLIAIHLACRSLLDGECAAAVAGGVNVTIHPNKYLTLGQGKFGSSKGRCESFGEGSDGYVPGEGVGAILLKPLSRAIADRDHIYGIVKGTAVNHGGKTNGYTVPNPNAQAEVIGRALKKAGIDPRTISYVEAHGTGTSLGDPIEIAGLMKTFREYTSEKQFCAIGSAKSNIGHCESASGIAGVTKVLLQFKYRRLAPSLHSKVLNPRIDFQNSPFIVQQEPAEWKQPVINGNPVPRRAGVNGFGAGGANAHVVLEEYIPPDPELPTAAGSIPVIVVLSAKNEERLKVRAGQLLSEIVEQRFGDADVADIAYTLQVGREAMDARLAVVVGSLKELVEKLSGFVNGTHNSDEMYLGRVKSGKEMLVNLNDDDMAEIVNTWISKRKFDKLADLWVKGLSFNWNKLYGDIKPRRISLPPYPFIKDRYWVPSAAGTGEGHPESAAPSSGLHPLIGRNTSNFKEQKFSTRFTGREFYLADHKVANIRTLPAVAYIEMAMAAGEISAEKKVRKLKNILWAKPITVDDSGRDVQISLSSGTETADFVVSSNGHEAAKNVHCQGKIIFGDVPADSSPCAPVDVEKIKSNSIRSISGTECYRMFKETGLDYGPGFRAIRTVFTGEQTVLAELQLPDSLKEGFRGFGLHPSLMDGAFQSLIGLVSTDNRQESGPLLPFSVGEIVFFNPLPERCYALVSASGRSDHGSVKKFTIRLLDENGRVLVGINDFTVREFRKIPEEKVMIGPKNTSLYYGISWKKTSFSGASDPVLAGKTLVFDTQPDFRQAYSGYLGKNSNSAHQVILVTPGENYRDIGNLCYEINPEREDDFEKLIQTLAQKNQIPDLIIHLWSTSGLVPDQAALRNQLSMGIGSVFYLSKALMSRKINRHIRLFYIYQATKTEPQPQYSAVSGFAKTIRHENSKYLYRTIELQNDSVNDRVPPEKLVTIVLNEQQADTDQKEVVVRYEDGERLVKVLTEITPAIRTTTAEPPVFLKKNGIYLITGGLGGLGLIFAEYFVKQEQITLILTGRSQITPEKQKVLDELKSQGSKITYIPADVSGKEQVELLINKIRTDYGAINGIIHSAGVTRDAMIPKKTRQDLDDVLAAKFYGTIWLDEALKDHPLDFFIMFSSIAGVWGNIGQSDYAFGNGFMDDYAHKREMLRSRGERSGKTISLDWPFWKDGGMNLDEQTRNRIESFSGITALSSSEGLEGFGNALASDFSQVIFLSGSRSKINEMMGLSDVASDSKPPVSGRRSANPDISREKTRQKIEHDLIRIIVEILKVKEHDIDIETNLSDYGMDSIAMMSMLNRIEDTYKMEVEPSAIEEYSSIKGLAGYLLPLLPEVDRPSLNDDNRAALFADEIM